MTHSMGSPSQRALAPGPSPEHDAAGPQRWLGRVGAALGQLMLALDATIMNVALPSVERSLQFTQAVRPWLVSAYLLPFALSLLPGGRLADALEPKRAFSVGLTGFASHRRSAAQQGRAC